MLTKESKIDQITINENKVIMYRIVTRILEDGKELSSSYHRGSTIPGDDTSTLPEEVKSIADTIWTPEVIQAYRDLVEQNANL